MQRLCLNVASSGTSRRLLQGSPTYSSNMAQKGEKGDVLCSVKPSYHADKENIDPFFDQQHSSGPGPSMFGMPSGKQQFSRATSSGKGRMPLADITALCMLQVCTTGVGVLTALGYTALLQPPSTS